MSPRINFSIRALLLFTLVIAAYFAGRNSQTKQIILRNLEIERLETALDSALTDISLYESQFNLSRDDINRMTDALRKHAKEKLGIENPSNLPGEIHMQIHESLLPRD